VISTVQRARAQRRLAGPIEVGLLLAILSLALLIRGHNIGGRFLYDYDEGVYMASASMMLEGYKLFSEIFSSQPPLFVSSIAGSFLLLGKSLAAARLVSILTSMLAIVSCYLISRRVSGPVAGLTSALFLSVSPNFLFYSRAAMAEVPSIGLGMLSVWLCFRYLHAKRAGELFACGIVLSLAVLMKLFAACILPLLILGLALERQLRALPFLLMGLALPALVIPYFGTGDAFDQILSFHARKPRTATLGERAAGLGEFLWDDAGLFTLAILGAAVCVARKGTEGRLTVGLTCLMIAMLLSYRSLFRHHLAILLPPLAVLAGVAMGHLASPLPDRSRGGGAGERIVGHVALALPFCLLLFYAAGVPNIYQKDREVICYQDVAWYLSEVVPDIRGFSGTDGWIVTDQQGLAFISQRKVPPDMCDTSHMRISSGLLDSQAAIKSLRDYNVQVVLLWTGRLARLEQFVHYVEEEFEFVKDYGGNRKLYARAT